MNLEELEKDDADTFLKSVNEKYKQIKEEHFNSDKDMEAHIDAFLKADTRSEDSVKILNAAKAFD